MKPPYTITSEILKLVASVSERTGEVKALHLNKPQAELRRKSRIKTIQSSLEIEGNTLTIEQITDILNNKRVLAPQKDILEVKNAIRVYNMLNEFNVYKLKSLCDAHAVLMKDLVDYPGKLRTSSVGIIKGKDIAHVAPPGIMVRSLMNNLFNYLKKDVDIPLIKSCVFHYELEFIHPFTDGNGRMGRLWQTLILKEYSSVFEFLPVETLIKERQQDYYNVLAISDNQGNSTAFIEFMLEVINDALTELLNVKNIRLTQSDRLMSLKDIVGNQSFSRRDYLKAFKNISVATGSRDLKFAVEEGLLEKFGDKRTTNYKFK